MLTSEWIDKAAQNSGLTRKAIKEAYDALFAVLEDSLLNGETVQICGLGSFCIRTQEAHTARNPKTNEQVQVDPQRRLVFLPGKTIKGKLNEK